jgi:putative tryptophan/tyrosine transport system substrate-binding protein
VIVLTRVLGALLIVLFTGALEAQPARIHRIGFLSPVSITKHAAPVAALLQGLREAGYQEGANLKVEYRWAEEKTDRLPALADELVRSKVEVIVTHSTAGARAARQATKTIPIVFAAVGDPVRNGIVASLARPGGNLTGLSFQDTELDVKRFEYLKQAAPGLSQVALLRPRQIFRDDGAQLTAAASSGFKASNVLVDGADDFARAFSVAAKQGAHAMYLSNSSLLRAHAEKIAALAIEHRLPTVGAPSFAEKGILLGYGANLEDIYRRAGGYVARVLKGAKPADLPIEQPTKFELVVNLKTARALGLTLPQALVARADRVID